jgi:hypothetical protein
VVRTPASYSGGAEFESLPGARYPDLGISCFFSPSRQIIVNHCLLTFHRDIPVPLKYGIHLVRTEMEMKILIWVMTQCALYRNTFIFWGAVTLSNAKNLYTGIMLWQRKETKQITISLSMLRSPLTLWSMRFEKRSSQLDWRKYWFNC